jgi:Pyridoxamine 5'-phosphate oxidase
MAVNDPVTELHPGFSSPDATATPWARAVARLEQAEIFWLSTVRPDGRPHVTPLIAAWLGDALYFSTGPTERKARNLEGNPWCVLTTGCNALGEGIDVVVEGEAVRTTDAATLQRVADTFSSKYGAPFVFSVGDGVLLGEGGEALVFEVRPVKAFGFSREAAFGQTRWRFQRT